MTIVRALVPALLVLAVSMTAAVTLVAFVGDGSAQLGVHLWIVFLLGACGVLAGAIVGGWLADRGDDRLALFAGGGALPAGALLLAIGSGGNLGWLLGGDLVLGIGQGMLLTLAFVRAARMTDHRARPWAIGLLLALLLLGGFSANYLLDAGVPALVGLALLSAALAAIGGLQATGVRTPAQPARQAMGGALLAAFGLFGLALGVDETRTGLLILLTPVRDDVGVVEVTRLVLLVVGAATFFGGAWLGLPALRRWRSSAWAAGGVGTFAFAAAGASLPMMMAASMESPGISFWPAAVVPGVIGMAAGAAWTASRDSVRALAVVGAIVTVAGIFIGGYSVISGPAAAVLLLASAAIGAGGGMVSVALRSLLADAPPSLLGSASAAGFAAALVGGQLGSVIGSTELVYLAQREPALSLSVVLVVASGVLGVMAALASPRRRPVPAPGPVVGVES
jgi:hypothetical protein